jgi:hypothetical protein
MHKIVMCQYGVIHEQCRCPAKDRPITYIMCDIQSHADNYVPSGE